MRQLRILEAGLTYHVMSRGNAKGRIFLDNADRARFQELLADMCERHNVVVVAYCQMVNHYHLVVTTRRANLSTAVRHLNSVYAQWWNKRHGRVGHVFQGRFKAQVVQTSTYLVRLCRYVALNPVRSSLVKQPDEWRWSSYRATIGLDPLPGYLDLAALYKLLDHDSEHAREKFRSFVLSHEPAAGLELPESRRPVIGDSSFEAHVLAHARAAREIPSAQARPRRPALSHLFRRAVRRQDRVARIQDAFLRHRYSLREIGDFLGVHYTTVGRMLAAARRAESDHAESDCARSDP